MGLRPGLKLPCRQCIGCRLQYSAEWATRCIHETKSHYYNTWITLTYNDENLPQQYDTGDIHPRTAQPILSGSLNEAHVSKYLRALRKASTREKNADAITADTVGKLRYYYAGEYGEQHRRPHYHACLFGIQFNDTTLIKTTELGHKLYESKIMKTLWPYGTHIIGELTFQTAAYTARYITKKINGQQKEKHYTTINQKTGKIIKLKPEFCQMSRNPGIGYTWYEKYKTDVHRTDTKHVYNKGKKTKTPRYYDKLHRRDNPEHHKHLKQETFKKSIKNIKNTTQPRLTAEEIITTAAIKNLKGTL